MIELVMHRNSGPAGIPAWTAKKVRFRPDKTPRPAKTGTGLRTLLEYWVKRWIIARLKLAKNDA